MAMTLGLEKKDRHAMAKWMKAGVELNERACQLGDDASCQALMKIEQALAAGGK